MCWQHHNKSSTTLFCYKATGPGCLLLCTAACLFPPSERCQATSLPPPPLPEAVAHTFVQPLCLVLFRLLKCSSFCWSPYQHNQKTAAGTEVIAKPSLWHQIQGGMYKFQVWWGSNAFIATSRFSSCHNYLSPLVGFPRVPQFWERLNNPHRATNQF